MANRTRIKFDGNPTELLHGNPSVVLAVANRHVCDASNPFCPGWIFPRFDEPTNHLDQDGRKQIAQYLKVKKPAHFIITSHDRDFLTKSLTIH